MPFEEIAIARDAAVILLCLEAILLLIVPLYLFGKASKELRHLMPRVRPWMHHLRDRQERVSVGVARTMAAIRAPFVRLDAISARLHALIKSGRGAAKKGVADAR